jgi:hypothetical protein
MAFLSLSPLQIMGHNYSTASLSVTAPYEGSVLYVIVDVSG